MHPEDPMAELFEICDTALEAAHERPLTDDEIHALRFAAGITGRAAAHDSSTQLALI